MDSDIKKIRQEVCKEMGRDPFPNLEPWELFEKKLPREMWSLLNDREGPTKFLYELPKAFSSETFATDSEAQRCWENIGNFYRYRGRPYQALSIYLALYDHLLSTQESIGKRIHKGTPLVWMSECYINMGFPALAKRCLMLSLCENAIHEQGNVSPHSTGTYWRLVYRHGLPDAEVKRYGLKAYEISTSNPCDSFYPEWVVQQFDDKDWMTEIPSPSEAGVYWANRRYVKKLIAQLGDSTGHALETLAEYILSCMPGCRTTKRKRTSASELDIVCSVEGIEADFRSEFGRYFVCECKDWKKAVDFTTIAKLCRILDSIKSRFGILFSPRGISGEKGNKFAARERLKIFQDRGIVLVVVNKQDLDSVAEGKNFISLLRREYERVRLDLPPSKTSIRHS